MESKPRHIKNLDREQNKCGAMQKWLVGFEERTKQTTKTVKKLKIKLRLTDKACKEKREKTKKQRKAHTY